MINKSALTAYATSALPILDIEPPASIRRTRGIATRHALWPQYSTLNISLFDMPEKAKDYIKKNIQLWQPHTNLKLTFISTNDGDIRISGKKDDTGNWSTVGIAAKEVPIDSPTMHINLIGQTADELNHAIRHEFGHALGLNHEHQHPDHTVKWNVKKVVEDAAKLGVNEAEAEANILAVLDCVTTLRSTYDQKSVMHYKVVPWLTLDEHEVPFNEGISEGDKQFMSSLYPPASPPTTP